MGTMLETLRLDGQPAETAWPYISSLFVVTSRWSPPSASPIYKRDSVAVTATVEEVIKRLDADTPVLFTMSISRAFFSPDPEGVISATEPMEKRIHALVAVGYGTRGQSRFILVRNSWGEDWGFAGHAWIHADYLTPRIKVAATMTLEL